MWARYKGAIFSKIFELQGTRRLSVDFIHVAETSDRRAAFGKPDLSYHSYPYKVLFNESSDHIPSYRLAIALVKDIFRYKADLVVIPGYHRIEYWAMLIACMALRRKRAVFCDSTANDNAKTRFKEFAKALFFRRCQGIFCYGIRSKQYVESYGIDPRLIFPDCQAAALPHDYDPAVILKRYGAYPRRSESPTFLFVGRLAEEKGLEDLLAAFQQIHQGSPMAKLFLIGPGTERDRLKRHAVALGVANSIGFLGIQSPDQIGEMLEISTAMILPSHREPWGLVVNEALSYGCPVVVSNVCGCVPELVLNGVTGYVFPAGDAEALYESMQQVIVLNEDRFNTATRCLEVISHHTPERAALEIIKGCSLMIEGRLSNTG